MKAHFHLLMRMTLGPNEKEKIMKYYQTMHAAIHQFSI